MPQPFSQDLRDRVLAAYDRGMKTRPIAQMFSVSPAWARRVKQRRSQCNQTRPRWPGPSVIIYKVDRVRLAELVKEDPDATLMELRQRLNVACGLSTICMALKELKLTFKKNAARRRAGSSGRRRATRSMAILATNDPAGPAGLSG